MLATSKDLLYLVLAFCVLWVTVFFCWLLYYFISIVGGMRKIVKSVESKIEKIDRLIDLFKDKIENSTNYLFMMVESVGKLMDYLKNKKKEFMEEDEEEIKKQKKNTKKAKTE
ncbi:MAG TPA: hypothetical protein PKZ16_01155 [bacterium]|nr:hypothetical protein [bacterium]HPL95490.1 hypothetical protein [bacterium]